MWTSRRAAALVATLGASALAARAGAPVSRPAQEEVSVYAAASLRDALQRLAPECGEATGARLVFNFGASNDLARQIEAANKADVFFSADEAWMDRVARAGLVDGTSRRSPLSNRLVAITPKDRPVKIATPTDLTGPGVRRISLADPAAVPAGKYAKAWLERAGVWEEIKGRVLPALDARAALAAVEAGGAEAGVVYRTDAAISKTVSVVYEVPEGDGPPISYAIAALRDRPHLEAARRIVAWLAGPAAAPIFRQFGFIVMSQTP